jgi:hypothetical protein
MATNPPVQIGELTNVPAPGSGVGSSYHQSIAARVMGRFATAAARTSAWAASIAPPAKGTPSYLATGNETEGPEYWDGVAWRRPWNMPWGVVAQIGGNTQLTGIGATETALLTSPAFAAPGGRRYRITANGTWGNTEVSNQARMTIRRDAGTAGFAVSTGPLITAGVANSLYGASWVAYDVPPVNAAQQYTLGIARMSGAGTFTWYGTSYTNFILVEDIGPAAATAPTLLPGDEPEVVPR